MKPTDEQYHELAHIAGIINAMDAEALDTIRRFEQTMKACRVAISANFSKVPGWLISYDNNKIHNGWGLYAERLATGCAMPLEKAPRSVRIIASKHLPELHNSIIEKAKYFLEEIEWLDAEREVETPP